MGNKVVPLTSDRAPRCTSVFRDEDVVSAHICNTNEYPARTTGGSRAGIEGNPGDADDIVIQARSVGGVDHIRADGRKVCDLRPGQALVSRLPKSMS